MAEVEITSEELKRIENRVKKRFFRQYHTLRGYESEYQDALRKEIELEKFAPKEEKPESIEPDTYQGEFEEIGSIYVPEDKLTRKIIYRKIVENEQGLKIWE